MEKFNLRFFLGLVIPVFLWGVSCSSEIIIKGKDVNNMTESSDKSGLEKDAIPSSIVKSKLNENAYQMALGKIPSAAESNSLQVDILFENILATKEAPVQEEASSRNVYEVSSMTSDPGEFQDKKSMSFFLTNSAHFLTLSKEKRIEFLVNYFFNQH